MPGTLDKKVDDLRHAAVAEKKAGVQLGAQLLGEQLGQLQQLERTEAQLAQRPLD